MVLFEAINKLANPNAAGSRRRRLFIPPSTNYPLFSYGDGEDQRSFLSLIENGSVYTGIDDDLSDAASVSTSRSLPSTLSSAHTADDQSSFHSWLLEEHQRRYSSIVDSDEDDNDHDARSRHSQKSDQDPHNHQHHQHHHHQRHRRPSLTTSLASGTNYEDFAGLRTTYNIELTMLFRYSLPLIITFVLEHFFSIVCLLVVGHLGKNELAAVSLGSMCSTITFAIFEGIATALDTLCPQAYGAGNYEMVSTHVQRCLVFSFIIYIPCAFVWWYSNLWLGIIIDSKQVLDLTVTFLRILTFGAPGYIFFENAKRFLQAQGIFEAGTGVLFISAPINIFLSYFLVWNKNYGIGYIGAPIATVINFWLMAVLLIAYVMFIDGDKCWYGFSKRQDLFQQWAKLSHLAIPGIVMLESEYMAYEIMTVFASYFGTTALAAQSAVASIASLTYMVPFAVSIASSTRIANFIGGGNVHSAQVATKTGLLTGVFVSFLNCIILFTGKSYISKLFSQDPEVIQLIVDLFNPLVSIIQIFDGIASVASGILRAQGLQKIGGVINFLSYYAFAIPLALVLSKFTSLELLGLWIGVGSGMILIGLSETCVILTSDWDSIILKAGIFNEDYDEFDEPLD